MNDINLYEKIPVEENNFPIRLVYGNSGKGPTPHWHEHLEMIFVISDTFKITSGGHSYDVSQNDLVIIHPNEIHFFDNYKNPRYLAIIINPTFFADVDFENTLLNTHIRNDETVKRCFENIFEERDAMRPGYKMEIKGTAYQLVAHILRNYTSERLSESDVLMRNKKMHRINSILQYISQYYNTNLTTASLAQKFNFNEHYFCHFFKEQTGQSPISFINRYRIQKAAVMLENTDYSISDIAATTGFDDTNYFSRTFKKYMGVSPSAYKKQK